MLRGSHGDVAGAESGASSAERSTGEHGNHPGSARGSRRQRGRSGWVHRRPSGPGWGGAVVVVAGVTTCHGARESRTQGEGRQQESRSEDAAMPKDALANVGAPSPGPHRAPAAGIGDARQPSPLCLRARRQTLWRARCGESRTPGSASGLGKRTRSNAGTAPQADSTLCTHHYLRRSAHCGSPPTAPTAGHLMAPTASGDVGDSVADAVCPPGAGSCGRVIRHDRRKGGRPGNSGRVPPGGRRPGRR